MLKTAKLAILNWCLKHLFCAATVNDVLVVKRVGQDKEIWRGNTMIPLPEMKELQSQAKTLLKFGVYSDIMQSLKGTANQMLFEKSKTTDDMIFGKAMLYTLDVLDQKLKNIAE